MSKNIFAHIFFGSEQVLFIDSIALLFQTGRPRPRRPQDARVQRGDPARIPGKKEQQEKFK